MFELNNGDTVQLKSGGPNMTIVDFQYMASCTWKDESGIMHYENFPLSCIQKV
jgi:uncharacterized protein YodC (DUF2158 family)